MDKQIRKERTRVPKKEKRNENTVNGKAGI